MYDYGRKPVVAIIYKNNRPLRTYDSITQACKQLGLDRASVQRCLSGEYNHTHGFTFRYADKRKGVMN